MGNYMKTPTAESFVDAGVRRGDARAVEAKGWNESAGSQWPDRPRGRAPRAPGAFSRRLALDTLLTRFREQAIGELLSFDTIGNLIRRRQSAT